MPIDRFYIIPYLAVSLLEILNCVKTDLISLVSLVLLGDSSFGFASLPYLHLTPRLIFGFYRIPTNPLLTLFPLLCTQWEPLHFS